MGFHGAGPPTERACPAHTPWVGYTACREPCQLRNEAGGGSCSLGLAPYPPRAPTATRQPYPTVFDSVCIPTQRSWQSFGALSPGLRNRNTASRLAPADTIRSRWLHLAAGHVSHNRSMVPVLFGTMARGGIAAL